jgi:hypothetical protein
VKPERDRNNRASYRTNWWIFGEPRRELRPALVALSRYIVTVETAKYRTFQFLDASVLPDNMLVVVASDDAFHLGVLSSRIHVLWALRSGGWLGVGNDPRYSKSRCFDPFPFPATTEALQNEIRSLAEELDETRRLVLSENIELTLTALYNVLDKLKSGASLSAKEEAVKTRGRILILKDLHDRIDAAVFRAYGWPLDLPEDQILSRLVKLNADRAAEERRGFVRWLRPDYQVEKFGPLAHRVDRVQEISHTQGKLKLEFPAEAKAQGSAVLRLMRENRRPFTPDEIAKVFKQGDKLSADVSDILRSLNRLGQVETYDNGRSYFSAA